MEYKNYCSCIFYALIEISLKMTWWRQRRRWMSRDRPRPTCCHRPRNLRREPIRHPENNSKQSLNLNLGQIVLFIARLLPWPTCGLFTRLSAPFTGQNKRIGNNLLYKTAVLQSKWPNHRCHREEECSHYVYFTQ